MKRKGIALVLSLLVLTALSVLGATLMFVVTHEIKMTSVYYQYMEALHAAESGVNEVIYRMRLPETDELYIGDPSNPPNPDWVVCILNTDRGSLPPSDDTTYTSTISLDSPLDSLYTTPSPSEEALYVHYKRKGAQIYFYDQRYQKQFLGDPSLAEKYSPIVVVEVTGRKGVAKRKIVVEMARNSAIFNVPGGVSAASVSLTVLVEALAKINFRIDSHVCISTTPWLTVPSDVDPGGGVHWSFETDAGGEELWHLHRDDGTPHPSKLLEYDGVCGRTGCIPGIVTPSLQGGGLIDIFTRDDIKIFGNPDVIIDANYTTPEIWELLGFGSEGEMNNNVTWTDVTTTDELNALLYDNSDDADNNPPLYIRVNNDGGAAVQPEGYGRGVLWIRGDAIFPPLSFFHAGTFAWKGIVYVGGDMNFPNISALGNARMWVLGTVAVRGDINPPTITLLSTQTIDVLYCPHVIDDVTKLIVGKMLVINWREIK